MDVLEFDQIRFSNEGAAELDGGRRTVFVPADEIVDVELVRATGAERPLLTAAVGVILCALACVPILMLINALRGAGTFNVVYGTAVAFAIPGWWLLDLSVRHRWSIRVRTKNDSRKLVFKSQDEAAIRVFFAQVRSRFAQYS